MGCIAGDIVSAHEEALQIIGAAGTFDTWNNFSIAQPQAYAFGRTGNQPKASHLQ